ncbi:MAG: TerB family tellurite resistance protein [Myxococcales bacterium]|nr:TerB family tellurite resistance protein [Myxococcales bacterium]
MKFQLPTPHQLRAGARALATIARVDGPLADSERAQLEAARDILGGAVEPPVQFDIDALEDITPAQLAAEIDDPQIRRQLLGGMIVMSFADSSIDRPEVALIAEYARAFELDDAAIHNLRRLAEGHLLRARLDILRRQWAPKKLREIAAKEGISTYWKAALGLLRRYDDPQVAARYRALGELPVGTLGRAYHQFVLDNEFSFPGERGSPPEVIVFHDMSHVLSGYGTTPEEEILVVSFSAGYSNYENYNWFMFALSQFQLGIPTAPGVPPTRGRMNPAALLRAIRRGAAMNQDLNEGWDYWDDVAKPIEDVRKRLNIPPREDP